MSKGGDLYEYYLIACSRGRRDSRGAWSGNNNIKLIQLDASIYPAGARHPRPVAGIGGGCQAAEPRQPRRRGMLN